MTTDSVSAAFPEELYPPARPLVDGYQRRLTRGYNFMREVPVIIAGLARNVSPFLPKTMARIEQLGRLFHDYSVVIFENDSTDDTISQLNAWASANPKVTVLSESLGMPVNPGTRCLDRAARMAIVRNKYREHIATHLSAVPYTIIVDTDLPGGWSYDGIANSFSYRDWDMMGSNGMLRIINKSRGTSRVAHFDAWAFRRVGHPHPHKPTEVNPLRLNRGEPPIQMLSCFGGLGIYKTHALMAAAYQGGDCEHVPLHLQMCRAGKKIYLNPSQIVCYGTRDW